jgi:hypothetical protein
MTLAHQHLDQLPPAIRSAVLANGRTKVVFQTTADDARVFAREFGRSVSDEDFLNLGQYEVLCRLATSDGVSQPVTGITKPPIEPTGSTASVRERSRQRYGRPLADVEAEIVARRSAPGGGPKKRPKVGTSSWD